MSERELMAMIGDERRDQAQVLAALPLQGWNAPTLCQGWRVREMVAHQTMPFRYRSGRFAVEMLKSGGRFNRMADRVARRDGASMSPDELHAALADNVDHPWKPPGGGLVGALSHDVIHGLDITVAVGIERQVPADRLRIVIEELSARRRNPFRVDLNGICLQANDSDWTFGSGAALTGSAQDLLLVLCGRRLLRGRLHGLAAEQFSRQTP